MLVTAADIADAEKFAVRLSDRGIIARHVASDTGRQVIPEVEEGFASGALLAITSPRLVSEGYDYPPLKVVVDPGLVEPAADPTVGRLADTG